MVDLVSILKSVCYNQSILFVKSRVKLKHFQKFTDTTEALSATTAAIEGKLSKTLKKTLKSLFATEAHEALAVADAKLGSAIKGCEEIYMCYQIYLTFFTLHREITN